LETWPRDELLLAEPATLAPMVTKAVEVRARPDTTLLLRLAPHENGATALVYLPLARMNTQLRNTIGAVLHETVGTVRTFRLELGDETHAEAGLARLTFRCDWDGRAVDEAGLNSRIRALVRGWEDNVRETLGSLPAILAQSTTAYRAQTTPQQAVADALVIENLEAPQASVHATPHGLMFRFYSTAPLPLVQTVMLLEGCGLQPTHEEAHTLGHAHLHVLYVARNEPLSASQHSALAATLNACLQGTAEEDSLNRLTLLINATPQELLLARAWVAYVQQLHRVMEPRRTRHGLWQNSTLTRALLDLFHLRLNPKTSKRGNAKALQATLEATIQKLPSADDERLWRTLLGIVLATLRTNLYTRVANEALAFKVNPAAIGTVAAPHPWREIFVYHAHVEGVHLRGGPIARGGLRHSNRGADYRTEVLGLMTAQMRKNTIIVPVGAKGGFFIRATPMGGITPKAWAELNYRRYIRALLSLTDNRTPKGETVAPLGMRCLDDADPYLVVAADKGTATYSDFANAESQAANYWGHAHQGFWLDDAFASGGKTGYDHKDLAITARGAWVSVLHHAGNLGILPTAKHPLKLVGIGDMAGDVFGNGLLRSPHVQLIAAFNHSHIFLDPSPDPAKTYTERQRCFKAGLAWDAYDVKTLSKGGGIYLRSAKSIALLPEAQSALGFKASSVTPDALIQAILAAPADVLWNGGIGTYIKASDEPHAAAQDKANDTTRIDAKACRAKIIGEGGNLGLTPRARVELAKRGVALNTDALDNSAGVDTSDHEVNLKILFALAEQKKRLTRPARNTLLASLTEDVCTLVLRDNAAQNLLISLEAATPRDDHAELATWQETLVKQGYADPVIDCLPSRKDLTNREDGSLTRPELAALVAASKAWLRKALMADTALL
ncbi:MAG: NAD-glutamate dehydrogenase domain-containing protein, partial [Pseudomonadota bacterium]